MLNKCNAVDLPLDIAPMAVGTGQQPKKEKTVGQAITMAMKLEYLWEGTMSTKCMAVGL